MREEECVEKKRRGKGKGQQQQQQQKWEQRNKIKLATKVPRRHQTGA